MGDKTGIEWTDATLTPIRARYDQIQNDGAGKERIGWHCEHVSEACRYCYAETLNRRIGTGRDFKPSELFREETIGRNNGEVKVFLDEKMLLAPLKWKKPRRIFVCSMTDLFADFVKDAWIDKIFAVMALCPQHTFQVLTKRPARMRDYIQQRTADFEADFFEARLSKAIIKESQRAGHLFPGNAVFNFADNTKEWQEQPDIIMRTPGWPLRHVWLGVSVEDQATADERIPLLLDTPAAIRFLSCEPLLGPVNLRRLEIGNGIALDAMTGQHSCGISMDGFANAQAAIASLPDLPAPTQTLNWIIAGGESGPHARPSHPDWIRALRDQCAGAAVPFFFKQWGEWHPCEWSADGPWYPMAGAAEFDSWQAPVFDQANHDGWNWRRIGKHRAGNYLDGRQHMEFPE